MLSPNEPITPQGISRVINQLDALTRELEDSAGSKGLSINLWESTMTYSKDDIVLFFKTEQK